MEQEMKEKLNKIPQWLTENENETWTVKGKKKDYILEEQNGGVIDSCQKLAEKTNTPMESLLASRSTKEPKLSDAEIKELKGGDYMRLKMAIVYIYGLNDFL